MVSTSYPYHSPFLIKHPDITSTMVLMGEPTGWIIGPTTGTRERRRTDKERLRDWKLEQAMNAVLRRVQKGKLVFR